MNAVFFAHDSIVEAHPGARAGVVDVHSGAQASVVNGQAGARANGVYAHPDARLCLRCGAGAALRLLARLDYRVFVLCLTDAPLSVRDAYSPTRDAQAPIREAHATARDAHAHARARAQGAAERLDDLLFREHVELSGYYANALHGGAVGTALTLRAADEHGVALASSWLVGSTLRAVEAGNRAGCRSVLVDDGREQGWRLGKHRVPSHVAPDVYAAAILIANAS